MAGLSPPRSGAVHREGKGLTCQALGPPSQHLLPSGPFCQLWLNRTLRRVTFLLERSGRSLENPKELGHFLRRWGRQ